ncbi:hypothetical protein HAX54_027838, partial [Datura stramonium]|nr:hypothetical protein [Datura stramonium]
MDHMIKDYPILKEEQRRNSKKQQESTSKAFKKAMKAAWGETSDEESEREDGESNLNSWLKVTQTQTVTPPRARTGLGYKNKPIKWDRKRKYV